MICSWFKRGAGKQFCVPTRWGSEGRLNVIGAWSIHGTDEHLEYQLLEAGCKAVNVIHFLRCLACRCDPERPTVVVMDNAAFHKSAGLKAMRCEWEAQGLVLRYLPAYCPFLNVIESVWRRVKGFLMPRRSYSCLADLRAAVLVAFDFFKAVQI